MAWSRHLASGVSRKDNAGVASMVAPLIAALASAWVALLVAASYLPVPLAGVLYVFGSVICHQIADRSFHIDGAQLPVCARCFGIYLGFCGASLVRLATRALPAFTAARLRQGRQGLRHSNERMLLLAAALPTALTIVLEWTGIHSSNLARAMAGAPLGAVVGLIVMAAVQAPALHYEACARTRPIESNPPPAPI